MGRTLLSVAFDSDVDLDSDLDLDQEGHGFSRAEKPMSFRTGRQPGEEPACAAAERNLAIGGSRQSKPRTSNYGGESAPTGQLYRQAKRTTVAANHGNCRISSTSSIPNPRPRDRHHYFLMLQPKRDGSGVTLTRGAIANLEMTATTSIPDSLRQDTREVQ